VGWTSTHSESAVTAFHLACNYDQPECVAALVELGCNMAITAKNDWTGKQMSEQQGHAAVLDVLRAAAAARLRAGPRFSTDGAMVGVAAGHLPVGSVARACASPDGADAKLDGISHVGTSVASREYLLVSI
jgi:hypothetical protein